MNAQVGGKAQTRRTGTDSVDAGDRLAEMDWGGHCVAEGDGDSTERDAGEDRMEMLGACRGVQRHGCSGSNASQGAAHVVARVRPGAKSLRCLVEK